MKHFNLKKSSLAAFLIMLAMLLAVSCDVAKEEDNNSETSVYVDVPQNLIGTWENATATYTETYTITKDTFSNGYYEGNNAKVFKINETSGYIYIKYTKAMNADYSYSETAPDVGKWYAISYKNLTDSYIELAGAYKKADGKTSMATIDEAKAEFTIENGYFTFYSELSKKN